MPLADSAAHFGSPIALRSGTAQPLDNSLTEARLPSRPERRAIESSRPRLVMMFTKAGSPTEMDGFLM